MELMGPNGIMRRVGRASDVESVAHEVDRELTERPVNFQSTSWDSGRKIMKLTGS